MILVLTILFTTVLQAPQQKAKAVVPFIIAGLTISEVTLLATSACLIAGGVYFATDEDARFAAQDFWYSKFVEMQEDTVWLGEQLAQFNEDVLYPGFVKIAESMYRLIHGHAQEKLADGTYTPDYTFDTGNVASVNGNMEVSQSGSLALAVGNTHTLSIINEYTNLTYTYDVGNPGYRLVKNAMLLIDGVQVYVTSGIPDWSVFPSMCTIPVANMIVKVVVLQSTVEIWLYGYEGTNGYPQVFTPRWQRVKVYNGGVTVPLTDLGAISVPATKPLAIDQTGALTVPITGSLANVNADTITQTVTDTWGTTMTAPIEWDRFKNLSLPDVIATKFPFSIPWDLVKGVNLLVAVPEVPRFEIPFKILRFGIDEKLVIDMADFETLAKICRFFLLILFMFLMVFATKKLIGGEG